MASDPFRYFAHAQVIGFDFNITLFYSRNRDSSFGIVPRPQAGRRRNRGSIPCRGSVQTSAGTHPASYQVGTGGYFPEVKRPGREANLLPSSSASVKDMWSYTSIPHLSSWRGA
jgi:hypothetical protein